MVGSRSKLMELVLSGLLEAGSEQTWYHQCCFGHLRRGILSIPATKWHTVRFIEWVHWGSTLRVKGHNTYFPGCPANFPPAPLPSLCTPLSVSCALHAVEIFSMTSCDCHVTLDVSHVMSHDSCGQCKNIMWQPCKNDSYVTCNCHMTLDVSHVMSHDSCGQCKSIMWQSCKTDSCDIKMIAMWHHVIGQSTYVKGPNKLANLSCHTSLEEGGPW